MNNEKGKYYLSWADSLEITPEVFNTIALALLMKAVDIDSEDDVNKLIKLDLTMKKVELLKAVQLLKKYPYEEMSNHLRIRKIDIEIGEIGECVSVWFMKKAQNV